MLPASLEKALMNLSRLESYSRRPASFKIAALCMGLLAWSAAAWPLEFADYDFSRWSQEVTECDRQASHGRDPGHVAPPVSSSTMDKDAAIEACLEAVAEDPDNPRLNYQLGRAYGYSNRGEEAMPYRLAAIEADYPQSLFVIGYLYFSGRTIEQNTCKALELWQRGAHYRRLAALVALPRHYMRGDFAECGVKIPEEDLRAYLNEAKSLSSDYYVGMLVEDLLTELERYQAP
jgi:tetratricopeptide (TPR) repeat protein